MMDSRSSLQEVLFRVKLLLVFCVIGAIAGIALFFGWSSNWQLYTVEQYIRILRALIFDSRYADLKIEMILSAVVGALMLGLPVIVFYVPKKGHQK